MKENPRIKPIEQATNTSWDEWLKFLESVKAKDLSHHEIATLVLEHLMGKVDNPGWWAQSITVAYEQYIGKRVPGQSPDGTFQISVSKSTKLSMKELMDAWVDFAERDKSVDRLVKAEVRVGGTDKRLTWRTKGEDKMTINVISEPKSNGNASIVVQLMGVQTLELSKQAKEEWAEIINQFLEEI